MYDFSYKSSYNYSKSYYPKDPKGSKLKKILIIAFSLGALFFGFKLIKNIFSKPTIEEYEVLSKLPRDKTFSLKIKSAKLVKEFEVKIEQDEKEVVAFEDKPNKKNFEESFNIDTQKLGLQDGKAKVIILAKTGLFGNKEIKIDALIKKELPSAYLIYGSSVVPQGGIAFIGVDTKDATKALVYVGKNYYYLYNETSNKPYVFIGAYPISVNTSPNTPIKVVVYDDFGNSYTIPLNVKITIPNFKRSNINITDSFIQNKVVPILQYYKVNYQNMSPVEQFKYVNETMRDEDQNLFRNLYLKSKPYVMWKGAFGSLPNSAVEAVYGEIRYDIYNNQQISISRHLGFDLASIKHAPVLAANDGIVAYTGFLNIYGNCIIIDHGLGVMSLYAHLNDIDVKVGQTVKKGQIIGHTDSTGLALGDHLHFGILVGGVEVDPREWWDSSWLNTHFYKPLGKYLR